MIICRFHWFVCVSGLCLTHWVSSSSSLLFLHLLSTHLFSPLSFLLFYFLIFFLSPPSSTLLNHAYYPRSSLCWFSPSDSIGTREGLFQKNLSGLLPVRDLRLDPSLLYSLPLLALSPNLLVVWIFLSVVFFLAKVRCG